MSMTKTDILIDSIQFKVTDDQVTNWVGQLSDIMGKQQAEIEEFREHSCTLIRQLRRDDFRITASEIHLRRLIEKHKGKGE